MMGRYKRNGWYGESHRHYLASKGVKTTHGGMLLERSFRLGNDKFSVGDAYQKGANLDPVVAEEGGKVLPKAFGAGAEFTPNVRNSGADVFSRAIAEGSGSTSRADQEGMHASQHWMARKGTSDDIRANIEDFDEMASVGTNANEIREVSKDMEDEYLAAGMSRQEAKARVKEALKQSKAYEQALMTSDDPDELMFAHKSNEKYVHMPGLSPKETWEFEERTGRKHPGESWKHYFNREATEEVDESKEPDLFAPKRQEWNIDARDMKMGESRRIKIKEVGPNTYNALKKQSVVPITNENGLRLRTQMALQNKERSFKFEGHTYGILDENAIKTGSKDPLARTYLKK